MSAEQQQQEQQPLATAAVAPAPPGLMTQIGMAGTSAVIAVTFIHPIDVVKVRERVLAACWLYL